MLEIAPVTRRRTIQHTEIRGVPEIRRYAHATSRSPYFSACRLRNLRTTLQTTSFLVGTARPLSCLLPPYAGHGRLHNRTRCSVGYRNERSRFADGPHLSADADSGASRPPAPGMLPVNVVVCCGMPLALSLPVAGWQTQAKG
jgi:hypothetical protein